MLIKLENSLFLSQFNTIASHMNWRSSVRFLLRFHHSTATNIIFKILQIDQIYQREALKLERRVKRVIIFFFSFCIGGTSKNGKIAIKSNQIHPETSY